MTAKRDREQFYTYVRNKEIMWAYLASAVSRNAGWNMTDLHSKPYKRLLTENERRSCFITYERANWLIFSDAFPQLLLYEESKKRKIPLFSLLRYFHVSSWMIREWERFWLEKNKLRLIQAQIVNEQHLIERPVIQSPMFQDKVFRTLPYHIQEKMHFSIVIFPTIKGDLYGRSVKNFTDVRSRIELGKELASILFLSPVKKDIYMFLKNIPHTGSRTDFEQFLPSKLMKTSPLRLVFPIVLHDDTIRNDWSIDEKNLDKYITPTLPKVEKYTLTKWYEKKRKQIIYASIGKKLLLF